MDALKEQVINTISSMDESQIESVWHFILTLNENKRVSWDDIPEV